MVKKLVCFVFAMCLVHLAMAQKDGPFKNYHDNGQLKTLGQHKNKKRVGEWKSYYETGALSSVYSYSNGKRNKTSKSFYKNGSLKSETKKIDGVFISIGYYESGNLFFERLCENGYYKEYFENGTLKIESNYADGQLSGIWKKFYPTGQLEWEVAYNEGYREGPYKQFYKNGALKVAGSTKKNKKEGEEKRYLKNGTLEWQGTYKNDAFNKTWNYFDASGKKAESLKFKKGKMVNSTTHNTLLLTDIPEGNLEIVPIFPGCENELNNKGRRKCMSNKVTQFVAENFNTDIAANLGLTGKYKILVTFVIDKQGHITEVLPKVNNASLKYEAFRVISLLPKTKPGIQRGKTVSVPYALPIIFQVKTSKKSLASKYGFKSRR